MTKISTLPVVLTGDRPTGSLHLGHYVGSLQNRLKLQEDHLQYILIADAQALTDNADRSDVIGQNVVKVALDYLAVGIDPTKSVVCVQSQLPALAELSMLLLNYVTVSRLERNPTVKQEIGQRGFHRDIPAGFLCYPVAQAADIIGFRAGAVPVGEDQLPMIEQSNELVRRINRQCDRDLLPEATPVLSSVTRLPGIDGRAKMSKSAGNAISLSASPEEISAAVRAMFTDPDHLRVSDPGRVEGNTVFTYLDAFDEFPEEVDSLKAHYRRGGLGDMALKRRLEARLQNLVAPIREKRLALAQQPGLVMDMLRTGTQQAAATTQQTLDEMRTALGMFRFT
ncbi:MULTISPECIES: tryptophan--tRNA ligase [unclassified Brevundimonas]|uniref:tryptophan--tRNA ligase n=1 Tax=unclassified Brevundimonas TaxID=2622653 RepID=UPI0025B92FB2|nr:MULTISPECIES: tryptophan--tRNA ligase [unclassified Brevundimonas]